MRLLALTSAPSADGRITEAEAVVGEITAGGTAGFVIFIGLVTGVLAGTMYVLVYRWLPSGRARGIAFGALLLLAFGTLVEPLRPSNPDFDIVGPSWVTVVSFTALALLQGALVAALAGRLSATFQMRVTSPASTAWKSPRALTTGRVVLVATAVTLLPFFVLAVADILSRGP